MKVVLHADDLGISRGITDRIIQTHRRGAVKRTGILANGEAFDYAVERLKENPGLSWSVHLNLVEGRSLVSKRMRLLVDPRGCFKRDFLGLLLLPILAPWCRAELRREIRSELDAQVRRVRNALNPNALRIDSHRYVHLLPFVLSVVVERAAEWTVRDIRIVNEPLYTAGGGVRGLAGLITPNLLKLFVLRFLSGICRKRLRRRGFSYPKASLGVLYSGCMTARIVDRGLRRISRRAPAEDAEVEVLFHPGPADPEDRFVWRDNPRQARFYFSPGRGVETAAALSPELHGNVELNSIDPGGMQAEGP
jgi:predicted glycoside hydrolase/deacetylase ChbG (UPF0249 family)